MRLVEFSPTQVMSASEIVSVGWTEDGRCRVILRNGSELFFIDKDKTWTKDLIAKWKAAVSVASPPGTVFRMNDYRDPDDAA